MSVEFYPWLPANALGLAVSVPVEDGLNNYYISGFEMSRRPKSIDLSRTTDHMDRFTR